MTPQVVPEVSIYSRQVQVVMFHYVLALVQTTVSGVLTHRCTGPALVWHWSGAGLMRSGAGLTLV